MRYTEKINENWLFYLNQADNADYMGYNDTAWQKVTLPHDWSVHYPFDEAHSSGTGYLAGGTAWYRKHLTLDDTIKGKRVLITFNGIYKHSKVWFNSNYLGGRAYGYSSFTFDVSEFAKVGENVISVRVEHEDEADSRWFTGSGIYRDVILTIKDKISFEENGIFPSTKEIDKNGNAAVNVEYNAPSAYSVRFTLLTKAGETVSFKEEKCTPDKNYCCLDVKNPHLWSDTDPYLYTLKCETTDRLNNVTDVVEISTGIRTACFDPDKGFFLNGNNIKIKGVCVHHDAGCLGAAVPKEVWRRRLEKLKKCGTNGIRTAHNPPDPVLLDLCDEMGFLVMDEAFDEWEGCKNKWWQGHNVYPPKHYGYAEDFPVWHKVDLTDMVVRDRHHPSIILWSIGNEIDYPNDPYVTPLFNEVLGNNDANKPARERMYNPQKPDASRLAAVAKELTELVHSLDTTRPVTSALSFPELSTKTGYADCLDVAGYNYKEQFYAKDHALFPNRPIIGSENSQSPECWYAVRDNDFISGQYLWTGIDFLGECPGWPMRISQAGMIDLAGFEKPRYYLRKALWTKEHFVKLAVADEEAGSNAWNESLMWKGSKGEKKWVSCYTSESSAELFVNGVSQGVEKVENYRSVWHVDYEDGEIMVVAGKERDSIKTGGTAASLKMSVYPEENSNIQQIEVTLIDKKGNTAGCDEMVTYQLMGDGEILGIENGSPCDLTPYSSKCRSTYNGRSIVYVRVGKASGGLMLYAFTQKGISAEITLKQR